MKLRVLLHEEDVFNIQKGCLSQWSVYGREQPNHNDSQGRYALIPFSEETYCVCKLLFQREIHPSYAYIDASVIHFKSESSNFLTDTPEDFIQDDKIEVLSSVEIIESLTVSVVFDSTLDIQKWKSRPQELRDMAHEILKLFTVTAKCIVLLKNLKSSLRHGIFAIIVNDASHCKNKIAPGKVSSNSKVSLSGIISKIRFEQAQNRSKITKLGGLEKTAECLKNIIEKNRVCKRSFTHHKLRPTREILLSGPPGCGKTSLVRQVAAESNATLLSLFGPELVSSKPGETEEALRRIFHEAFILADESDESVCVLLLNEVDILCPRRDAANASTHSTRATVQLLSLLEQADNTPGLVVIATTSKANLLDPAARRPGRLEYEVYIGIPTESERESILNILLEPMSPPNLEQLSQKVAAITPGYVGSDLSLVCQEVALIQYLRKNDDNADECDSFHKWITDFQWAVTKIRPSNLKGGLGEVVSTPTKMDSIGGLQDLKRELQVAVEWPLTHPEAFQRLGLPRPKGVLLYGPPGCAKTTLAKALATTTNTTFLSVSAADLYSPYVGEAEQNIIQLFERARIGAPTILFIDEIDGLVGSRGDRERGAQERVLSALLTEMDGVGVRLESPSVDGNMLLEGENHPKGDTNVHYDDHANNIGIIVIAATNRPDMLDDALLRPGRFDKLIYVPAPNAAERLDILSRITQNMPLSKGVNLATISESTNLFSGADLSNLCVEAALCALSSDGMSAMEINQCHFEKVLQELRPSLTPDQIEWYSNYKRRK